jgi:hypothetical protein
MYCLNKDLPMAKQSSRSSSRGGTANCNQFRLLRVPEFVTSHG